MAALNFDPKAVTDNDLLPDGDYLVVIEKSEVAPTKAGTGTTLNLTLAVADGAFKKRKIFWRINLANNNPTAQGIGQRQLKQLCRAINGNDNMVSDSYELHNKPFIARVDTEKGQAGYEDRNRVKEARSAKGAPGATTFTPPPAQAQPAAQSDGIQEPPPKAAGNGRTPPWMQQQAK